MGILVGLFGHVLIAVIHLMVIALDVTLFFLAVRCLAKKWPVALFATFDHIGSSLVDPLLRTVKPLGGSYRARFLTVSLTLTVFRLGLVVIAHSFIARAQ